MLHMHVYDYDYDHQFSIVAHASRSFCGFFREYITSLTYINVKSLRSESENFVIWCPSDIIHIPRSSLSFFVIPNESGKHTSTSPFMLFNVSRVCIPTENFRTLLQRQRVVLCIKYFSSFSSYRQCVQISHNKQQFFLFVGYTFWNI